MTLPSQRGPFGAASRPPASAPRPMARAIARLVLLLPALPALLLAGCGGAKAPRAPRVAVTVATVERRDVPLELVAPGTVEAIETADVGSQVGGTVVRIEFREGQDVVAGQPLFQLDPRPFQADLARAEAVLERDRAQYESARLEAERAGRLVGQNLVSASEYEQKTADAGALRATVVADSATAVNARLNLQYATIRAPVGGRTGALLVHVGDLVRAGTVEPLVTINRLQPIYVSFSVPESDLARLQRHRRGEMRVFARAAGDSVSRVGRLAFVDNRVDPSTGTLLLKGEFPNRGGELFPGQLVEARLELAVEDSVVVAPAVAVTTGQQGPYVYVLGADSTVTPRPVVVSRTQGDMAVVSDGLQPGEVVVTDGQFRLSPGARVLVRNGSRVARP